jgi:hypothetical protein
MQVLCYISVFLHISAIWLGPTVFELLLHYFVCGDFCITWVVLFSALVFGVHYIVYLMFHTHDLSTKELVVTRISLTRRVFCYVVMCIHTRLN